ncbi:MAG: hypothetical protein ACE5IW_01405 [bacterium]
MKNKWPLATCLFLLTVSLSCSSAFVQHSSHPRHSNNTKQDTSKFSIGPKKQPQPQVATRRIDLAQEQNESEETVIRTNKGSTQQAQNNAEVPNPSQFRLENIQRVTPVRDYRNPVWSPSKPDLLAFVGGDGTYLFSIADGKMSKVSDEVAGFKFFWTADGKTLVYRARIGVGVRAIKQIDIDKGTVFTLVQSNDLGLPQEISPGIIKYRDGQQYKAVSLSKTSSTSSPKPFADQLNNQIFVVTNGMTKQISGGEGTYFLPQVSPDGSRVLYQELTQGLYVTSLQTNDTIHLGLGDDAVWSPDSQYLLFEITIDGEHSILASELYITDLNGHRSQLTNTSDLLEMRPSWSSDGNHIAFDANGAIYIAHVAFGR